LSEDATSASGLPGVRGAGPTSLRHHHLGGLDGLRALAVLAVVAYHLGFGGARGGFLGVDIFFVLSGFLITTLLLEEHHETGRISLGAFWARRARRLLPALFVMVAVVCVFPLVAARLGHPAAAAGVDLGALRASAIATLAYVANWHAIVAGNSYFAQFSAPSALAHTWSLAIEEQFYVVWPLLTLGLVRLGALGHRRGGVALCAALAGASSLAMAVLYDPASSASINRVYYGTDTRLFDLAVGAATGWLLVGRPVRPGELRWLRPAGLAALAAVLVALVGSGDAAGVPRSVMFRGGFLVVALLVALVLAALRDVEGPLHRLLALRPLRAVGRVSYGLYLWHWPIIVYVTPAVTGLGGHRLLAVRVALMAGATVASYVLVEQPIRQRRLARTARRVVLAAGVVGTLVAVVLGTVPSLSQSSTPASVLARYAPSVPPTGSGGVVGLGAAHGALVGPGGRVTTPRILLYGDSVPSISGPGIAAALRAMPTVRFRNCSRGGRGIESTGYRWRIAHCSAGFAPNVVIVMTRWDDDDALADPARYRAVLQRFVGWLEGRGVRLVAFEAHPVQNVAAYLEPLDATTRAIRDEWAAARRAWNRAARAVTLANPGRVVFFSADRAVNPHGRFANWLAPPRDPGAAPATWARVRWLDGTHLCEPGTELFAAALAQDVAATLDLASPRGDWWLDGWQKIPERWSAQLAANCPADHP
jgi:peptidoglycan/LPS O-acetylase OafA/YrhL